MTYDWYARMLLSQSRYTEASKYFLQAYNISKKMYGEIHEQTVILLNDLGTVSYKQEKYDEAIEYLSAASEIGNYNINYDSDHNVINDKHNKLYNISRKKFTGYD